MRIGFDVDGVFTGFEYGYAPLLTAATGIQFPRLGQPDWPDTWFWERAAGVTKEQETAVWKQIMANPTFWLNLPPLPGAMDLLERIRVLSLRHDVYFVTNRPGVVAKQQTEVWLATHSGDFTWNPTVIVSSEKGLACRALKLDVYIDDKYENCADAATGTRANRLEMVSPQNLPSTAVFLLNRPWNTGIEPGEIDHYFTRVNTVEQMLDSYEPLSEARQAA